MTTQFEILQPDTVTEVCNCLAEHGDRAVIHAGGTDLLVRLSYKALSPAYVVDLSRIDSLKSFEEQPGNIIRIGCMATIAEIASQKIIFHKFRALFEALESIGSPQIRNRGTLAGNICNASPAADCVPPLLVYGAQLNIVGQSGSRRISMDDFIVGPGMTSLAPNEFVESVDIPIPKGICESGYQKIGRRKAVDCSIVGVAVRLFPDNSVNISFGAVAPKPFRATGLEKLMKGNRLDVNLLMRAIPVIQSEIEPIDDIRASKEYREEMSLVLYKRAYESARKRLARELVAL